jgi:drug/metabolite transporter (DMT)-like permease
MLWLPVVLALTCAVLWGASYVILEPAGTQLSSFTINFVYGTVLAVTNLIALCAVHSLDDLRQLRDTTISLSLFGYVAASVVAAFVFLRGYALVADTFAAGFTAVSSTYPVFTFLFAWIFLHQNEFNMPMALSGLALTTAGIVLLAFAQSE